MAWYQGSQPWLERLGQEKGKDTTKKQDLGELQNFLLAADLLDLNEIIISIRPWNKVKPWMDS